MTKKDAYYFSHDSNARNDLKMVKLRRKEGLAGIGLFWCVIEMLRESKGYELPVEDIEDICYELRCEEKSFETLFVCELLTKKDDVFYSISLKNRLLKMDEKKERRRIAGSKGGKAKANNKQKSSNATKKPSNALANPSNKTKEDKTKEDKTKEDKKSKEIRPTKKLHLDSVKLTDEEFEKLVERFGEADAKFRIGNLNNYICSTGKKYKSHYHTILMWAKNDPKPKQEIKHIEVEAPQQTPEEVESNKKRMLEAKGKAAEILRRKNAQR